MRALHTSLWAILLVATSGALPAAAQERVLPVNSNLPTTESPTAAHALQISGGDLLEVNVFDTPELSGKLRVDERGNIALPVGGVLPVAGLTTQEAARRIEARLRETEVLNEPHVAVTALEYATQGVTIAGEVKNPGVFPLLGAHNLLDMISAAGGLTAEAGATVTGTHRADPEHPFAAKVGSRSDATSGVNLDIRPGDTIVVSHAGIIYVVGAVGKPGAFLMQHNDRLSVIEAIALAQGTSRSAALNSAKLIRKSESARQELPVSLKKILANKAPDEALFDGDILFVPSSGAKNTLIGIEQILPALAGAAIYRVP